MKDVAAVVLESELQEGENEEVDPILLVVAVQGRHVVIQDVLHILKV